MHRSVRAAAAALVAVALAGCWPAPGQGPDRRAHNPDEAAVDVGSAPSLAPVWTAVTDPAATGGTVSAPTLSHTAVHVSTGTTGSHAFDRATGAALWSYPDEPFAYWQPSPIADGDRVLASWGVTFGVGGAWLGETAWLDARTGAVEATLPTGVVAGRRGSRVLMWTRSGSPLAPFSGYSLRVVDEATPADSWGGTAMFTSWPGPQRTPTLGAHRVYHAGTVTTAYAAGGEAVGIHAYPVTPAPATDCVAPHPDYPQLPRILCPTWSTPTDAEPVTSPVVGAGEAALYVGLADGTLLALDTADGSELWRAALGAAPSADPALADGWLYVPLTDGTLAVVDAATGTVAWTADTGGAAVQPAVAGRATPGADGVVLVGTDAGDLVALPATGCGATTCTPVATIDVGGAVTGAPAVSGGRVYIGVAPNRVVALTPGGP